MVAVMTSEFSLSLRLRTEGSASSEPDLAAFRGRAPADAPAFVLRPGVMARSEITLFVPTGASTIPLPGAAAPPLPIAAWHLRATIPGHVTRVRPQPRDAIAADTASRRAPWLLAACLPLTFAAEAIAAPRAAGQGVGVQRPKPSAPTLPDPSPESTTGATEGGTPDPGDTPSTEPTTEDPAEPTSESPATSTEGEAPTDVAVPPPSIDAAIVDAAWEGVDGFDVDLQLAGGARKRGIVGAIQRETFTLIDHESGEVFVLRKDSVVGLRVHRPEPLPLSTGGGYIGGGVVLDVIGAPMFISGVVLLAVCPSCVGIHLPLTIIGAASLGAGIPLTVKGVRLRRKYLRAAQERGLALGIAPTREGWSGGLRFRF